MMNTITLENNAFVYAHGENKTVLLNLSDLFSNKSKIPFSSFEGNFTIPALITNTFQQHLQLVEGTAEETYAMEYLLLDILLVSKIIQSQKPMKVLEIGCTNGLLSFNYASILGKFNQNSSLCCVSDTMGNESGNEWLDKMVLVEESPKFSLLTSDYEETPLAEDYFDMVVINGSVLFEEPYKVIKEAERLVKINGMILCYCESPSALEENFQRVFLERQEYKLYASHNVLQVCYDGKSWAKEPEDCWREELPKYYEEVQKVLHSEKNIQKLRELIQKTDTYIEKAMNNQELELKVELLHLKDKLLDYMF